MKYFRFICFLASLSSAQSFASIVWDTTSGAGSQTYRASYSNIIGPDWISVATPVTLSNSCDIASLSFVGAHLRFDGTNLLPTDPGSSGYSLNAWSSSATFQASPLQGDLWSYSGTFTREFFGFGGSGNSELSLFTFNTAGSLSLPGGTSIIGIHSESLPATSGVFYWSSTSNAAPSGFRVKQSAPNIENLPNAQSLKIVAVSVPEPTTILAMSVGIVAIIKKRKKA